MSGPAVKKLKTDVRRLDGMQRELYSLLGENTPPALVAPDKFKSKPSWRQKVAPWQRAPFKNKARSDGLELRHWVRGQPDEDEVYRFAQFNTTIDVPEWSDEDYVHLKRDDWTYEETKYLFDLCRDYDLRWHVVHDRYMWPTDDEEKEEANAATEEKTTEVLAESKSGPGSGAAAPEVTNKDGEDTPMGDAGSDTGSNASATAATTRTDAADAGDDQHQGGRSIEDLKERYYEVCRSLLQKSGHMSPADEELVEQMKFPKEREILRKAHLQRMLSRSAAEVAEEEALVLESRRLEAQAERMLQERNEIVRLLDTPAATGSISAYQTSAGIAQLTAQLMAEKSRKPKEVAPTPTAAARKEERKSGLPAQIMQKRLSAKEEAAYGISYQERGQGAFLRSSKLSTLKQGMATRAHAVFNELGLPSRPIMPTAKVSAKFESLQQSITVLLEAKKVQDRLETEIRVLKASRETRGTDKEKPKEAADPTAAAGGATKSIDTEASAGAAKTGESSATEGEDSAEDTKVNIAGDVGKQNTEDNAAGDAEAGEDTSGA